MCGVMCVSGAVGWEGVRGGGDAWLENVHMAGRNGAALIGCLQISRRLPPVRQDVDGRRCEAGASPPPRLGSRLINHRWRPFEKPALGRMSAVVLFVWTPEFRLCMLSTDYLCPPLLVISQILRWSFMGGTKVRSQTAKNKIHINHSNFY